MIRSFAHKGLKRLYERDDASGIGSDLVDKVRTILLQLDEAQSIDDMRMPGFRLHGLKGDKKGYWSVTVKANWRIIFKFDDAEASDVELLNYH
ncbi:MAG: peptidase [Acidobacteria bacterium]|nr:peptidase [Acidobacteriota bacterium]